MIKNSKKLFRTCLLYCIMPSSGKTQAQLAGRISESAKPNHWIISARSMSVLPLNCSLATENTKLGYDN